MWTRTYIPPPRRPSDLFHEVDVMTGIDFWFEEGIYATTKGISGNLFVDNGKLCTKVNDTTGVFRQDIQEAYSGWVIENLLLK